MIAICYIHSLGGFIIGNRVKLAMNDRGEL